MHPPLPRNVTVRTIPRFYPHKAYVLRLIQRREMEAVASEGAGTRAAKRSARLGDGITVYGRPLNLFPSPTADVVAEHVTEGRPRVRLG
jgi:hypothetical protein